MFKINRTDKVDINLYDERINRTGFILFDRDRLNRDLDYYNAHAETCYDLARMRMLYKSQLNCAYMNQKTILRYLMEYEHCPESFFSTGKTKGYSLESKRVLVPLLERGFAQMFLEPYMEYKSWSAKCSKIKTIVTSCTECIGENVNGVSLYKLPFLASLQKNLRFNYKDFDIISQIPKSMADCISVEDGYFLAWGDFAQSDLRIAYNLYLRTPENDKIFAACSDKYEAIARMLAKLNNEQFDIDTFKAQRQSYKKNTLATVYGQRSTINAEDNAFVHSFANFIEHVPTYEKYCKRIDQYNELKMPLMVSSYFGFVQQMYDGYGSSANSKKYEALNTPCQTGTSELVILVVNHILDTAYKLGYTEDDISLYMTRHDEPIFKIKNTAKDLMTLLYDHSTIIVDDWSPLQLDWEFGYNYKITDDDLTHEFETKIANFQETQVPTTAFCNTDYEPLPALFTVGIAKCVTPDAKTIVTFYDNQNNEAMYSLLDTIDQEAVDIEIKRKMRDAESNLDAAKLNNILCFSQFLTGYDYYGHTNFTYRALENNPIIFAARRLCDLMTWRYCEKAGLEPNVEKPVFTTYDQWINNVKDSRYLIVNKEE